MGQALGTIVDKYVPAEAVSRRMAVALLAGIILFVAAVATASTSASPGGVPVAAILFLSGLALVLAGAFMGVRDASTRTVRVTEQTAEARGGRRVLGIDVGAHWVRYGVITVNTDSLRRLPAMGVVTPDEEEPLPVGDDPRQRIAQVAHAIKQTAGKWDSIDGIGMGIPGQIDPEERRIVDPTGTFANQGRLVDEVVTQLRAEDSSRVRQVFDLSGDVRWEVLRDKIQIDNEVRCATRHLLSCHLTSVNWRNFAYLAVGANGVGSGFVFNRQMYYGDAFAGGEIGHTTVHLDPRLFEDKDGNGFVPPVLRGLNDCQCGKKGFHFESLISPEGFVALAERTDQEAFGRLTAAFAAGKTDMSAPRRLLAACLALEDVVAPEDVTAPEVVVDLVRSKPTTEYLNAVLRQYGRYLGVGTANLLNVLNLDHLRFGGDLLHWLWKLRCVRQPFHTTLDRYALRVPARVQIDSEDASVWIGAGLLRHDPSYDQSVEPVLHGPPESEARVHRFPRRSRAVHR